MDQVRISTSILMRNIKQGRPENAYIQLRIVRGHRCVIAVEKKMEELLPIFQAEKQDDMPTPMQLQCSSGRRRLITF